MLEGFVSPPGAQIPTWATASTPLPPAGSAVGLLKVAMISLAALSVLGVGGGLMGEVLPLHVLVLWGMGAVLAYALPAWRIAISVATGAVALAMLNPTFSAYLVALLAALMAVRARALPFVVVLAAFTVIWPKTAFSLHYHQPGYWNWLNEPSLALALFVSAVWWRSHMNARRDANAPEPDALSFLLLYLFPSHATNPMVFGPAMLARPTAVDVHSLATGAFWFVAKVLALMALRQLGPGAFLRNFGGIEAASLTPVSLWGVVAASYVETYLVLAASADIPVMIGRLFGFQLPAPFRAPLLAQNPVELWRRWGIYNRRMLIELVYLPLGGSGRHRYRNVILTFLASALVLHSGWFGSKYWAVGRAGWFDQSLYFLLQAVAVCACLAMWSWTGKQPSRNARPVWSLGAVAAVIATQAWSALAHVVVLAPELSLADRARVVARCLGLG